VGVGFQLKEVEKEAIRPTASSTLVTFRDRRILIDRGRLHRAALARYAPRTSGPALSSVPSAHGNFPTPSFSLRGSSSASSWRLTTVSAPANSVVGFTCYGWSRWMPGARPLWALPL